MLVRGPEEGFAAGEPSAPSWVGLLARSVLGFDKEGFPSYNRLRCMFWGGGDWALWRC
jgi:hypothetical protein